MDYAQKTHVLIDVMDKRTTLRPPPKPLDSRLSRVHPVPWEELFTPLNPAHAQEAAKLIKILTDAYDFDDFVDLLEDCRSIENDRLFLYALYSSVLHRDDCQGVILPPIEECAPHWFFAAETIHDAIQLSIHLPNEDHVVTNEKTAEDFEPESRLAYFREDIGLNTHHWSWHVVFPSVVVGKVQDRKGEMFYYMHQQLLARYNWERLSNGFNRVSPLQNFQQKLTPYFPHMTSQVTGVHMGSRPEGLTLRDLPTNSVQDLEMWRIRILEAIDLGFVRDANGNQISLINEKGIDILGSIVESNSESVNRDYYGNLHNTGHVMIAAVHDPDDRFREHIGVMAFIESSPRDTIFYEWHKFLDNIFQRHKSTLKPYTREELLLEGIKIVGVEMNTQQNNLIETFMKEDLSDLSHAPFLKTKRKISVRYQHLDHRPFVYVFNIVNELLVQKHVTVRVFLGPKFDERRRLLDINEQRHLMIEMDKFQNILEPGLNIFTRKISESSVTAPRERRVYRVLLAGNVEDEVDYCTCGWPEHLLIPKGNAAGMDFNLFVMCTDYNEDKPDEVPKKLVCKKAFSYCGSKDQKYPDKKPMGFPFDRPIIASNMAEFLTSNMIFRDVKIKFLGLTEPATENPQASFGITP